MGNLMKWNETLFPNVSRLFDDFFRSELTDWTTRNFAAMGSTMPAVNIKETDDDFQIEVAAPGMNKKDFNVEVDNGMLVISAEREVSDEEKNDNYTRKEFSYQSFKRSFMLPDSVDAEKINAKYTDGILRLSLPKKPEAKPQPAKTIKIS
ncbi:MAG: Hsp20/alpha crystallin family protein [Bacteroidetes bacterium]|nr:MAG: Hsp20/alpha crystallin family protein [Bacteroidota bacterium]